MATSATRHMIERRRYEKHLAGTRRNGPMKTLNICALAALIAAAPSAFAQTPTPSPDPSAASSPHQRDVTGSKAPESAATNGSAPDDASSPHQRDTLQGSKRQDNSPVFVKKAAQDGMTEVELGQCATDKSNNSAVKRFAQQMVQDHRAANAELSAIAKERSLNVPAGLDAEHQGMVKELAAKSGAAFDADYARHMAMDHTQAIELFQSEAKSSDPGLAAFAKKTLPTLQEHMRMADRLTASVASPTARAMTQETLSYSLITS
jgi:putative membrane protein